MPTPGEPALVVEGLVSGYGGGDVLHEVSMTVPEGGITCVGGQVHPAGDDQRAAAAPPGQHHVPR
jgi:hypothetical protein